MQQSPLLTPPTEDPLLRLEELATTAGPQQDAARLTLARKAEFPEFRAALLAALRRQGRPCQCGSGQPWESCHGNPDSPGCCG